MKKIGRMVAAFTTAVLVASCAALPDTSGAVPRSEEVRISTKSGWLSYSQSQQLIKRLDGRASGNDFLARHLQVEEAVAGTPLVTGNQVKLFADGPSTYRAAGDAIKAAKHYIHLESYIFEDDEVGNALVDTLVDKVRQGVAVAVMVDGVGTLAVPQTLFDRLRAAGAQVVVFNPINPLKSSTPFNINERSHRKILVVDGVVGFVGGVNVSSVYSSKPGSSGSGSIPSFGSSRSKKKVADPDKQPPWRDTHLSIRGPAVADIERVFIAGWESQNGPALERREFYPPPVTEGQQVVRIVVNNPGADDNHAIYLTMMSAIASAAQSIHITMAYFVPDPAFLAALADAAKRGVDTVLILPGFSDSSIVFHAGRSNYDALLEAGVKIYERNDALLHAKTAVIDGVWSTAGSSNMDWRSFTLNHEINAIVLGPEFGSAMEALFANDVEMSHQVTLEAWRNRGVKFRVLEMISRFGERWL